LGEAVQYPPGKVLPGTVYRVVRHLATGGMGSVYDVEDMTVEKRYVLKTLHPQLVSRDDLARRMRDEAKALAKLNHPNIVDVITAGITQDHVRMPFYVMERLNGQNLRVVLEKKGSLDISHCFRIAIDVADALEHAHENSIVHRDVKPENIFLHRNANGTTTTKLLDFGIVRLLDRKASHTHGKFIGTLRYASPEQIMGEALGPATDIYSLGVVLYEMICGRGPFDDIGDAYAIGAAHAQRPAPPLSQFTRVPAQLERLVMQTLAKQPGERPRDCFTLASELRRMLREEENGPRSATAVNVITSASGPDTRAHPSHGSDGGVQHTPPMKTPIMHGHGQVSATAATEHGMIPPSVIGDTLLNAGMQPAPVEAIAPTVAASPPKVIDRDAATRASAPVGATQRLAQNDTRMEGLEGHDEAVRALAEPAPLIVPPTTNPNHAPISSDFNFPPAGYGSAGTGPLAGEARTRPPEKGIFVPLFVAVAIAIAVIGAALIVVTKPWARRGPEPPPPATAAPLPPPTATTPATPTVTAPATTIAEPATLGAKPQPVPTAHHSGKTAAAGATVAPDPPPTQRDPAHRPPTKPGSNAPANGTPKPEDIGF